MAKLIFISREHAGREYDLMLDKNTVGRKPDNTLVIEDKSVSGHHCEILVYGNEVIVRDHGSSNGTFVNDQRVKGQMQVLHGQTLRFGLVETRLELDPSDETDTYSDVTAVHSFVKLKREQEKDKEKEKAKGEQGASPALNESELPKGSDDQTIIVPRPALALVPELEEKRAAEQAAPAESRRPFWLLVIGILVGAVVMGVAMKLLSVF